MTSLNLIDTSPLSEVTIESEVTENMLPECQTEFVIGDAPVSTVHHLRILSTLPGQAIVMISPYQFNQQGRNYVMSVVMTLVIRRT